MEIQLKRLLLFTSLLCFSQVSVNAQSCIWAGRVYSDQQLLNTGGACQICQAGKWVDHAVACGKCTTTPKPAVTNPTPGLKDCTDQRDGKTFTFTDGARVIHASGKRLRCSAGIWLDSDVPVEQRCH